jgi:hypothetical protein
MPVPDGRYRYFIGKDYSNPYDKDFEFVDKYDEGLQTNVDASGTSLASAVCARLCLDRLHRSQGSSADAVARPGPGRHRSRGKRLRPTLHPALEHSQGQSRRRRRSAGSRSRRCSRPTSIVSTSPIRTFCRRAASTTSCRTRRRCSRSSDTTDRCAASTRSAFVRARSGRAASELSNTRFRTRTCT